MASPSGKMIGMSFWRIQPFSATDEARRRSRIFTKFSRDPIHKLELFRMDDERIWERRKARLPKQFGSATLNGDNFRHLWHSPRRRDVPPAVGALVFEAFGAHDGVDALGQRNVFIKHLALRVSPLFACRHGHAQYIMRVNAVSHAST